MVELKTLKDFRFDDNGKGHSLAHADRLKTEGIKWAKECKKGGLDCKTCPVEVLTKGGCPAGDPQGCGFLHGLKLFFNITEEELK